MQQGKKQKCKWIWATFLLNFLRVVFEFSKDAYVCHSRGAPRHLCSLWQVSGAPGHFYWDVCWLVVGRLYLEKYWALAPKPRWVLCLDMVRNRGTSSVILCSQDSPLPTTGSCFYLELFPSILGEEIMKHPLFLCVILERGSISTTATAGRIVWE